MSKVKIEPEISNEKIAFVHISIEIDAVEVNSGVARPLGLKLTQEEFKDLIEVCTPMYHDMFVKDEKVKK